MHGPVFSQIQTHRTQTVRSISVDFALRLREITGPLASLGRALQIFRAAKQNSQLSNTTANYITLRAGTYYLRDTLIISQDDSGVSASAPTIFRSYTKERCVPSPTHDATHMNTSTPPTHLPHAHLHIRAVISGGVAVSGWEKLSATTDDLTASHPSRQHLWYSDYFKDKVCVRAQRKRNTHGTHHTHTTHIRAGCCSLLPVIICQQ